MLVGNISLAGAVPQEEWSAIYGGMEYDNGYYAQETQDGGYVLAGETLVDYGEEDSAAFLVKLNSDGVEEWNRTFGGPGLDSVYSVKQSEDGEYLLAGSLESRGDLGAGLSDAWLIKTDSNGTEEWNKTFGGADYDSLHCIQKTEDGGYILAGGTSSFGAGFSDAWLIKTDSEGTEEWNRTFGGNSSEYAFFVNKSSDGGYIMAGYNNSSDPYIYNAWLIKTDSKGNEEWNKTFGGRNKTFGGTYFDCAYAVQELESREYVIAGIVSDFGAKSDAWLIKTDSNGTEEWNKTFGGPNRDRFNSAQRTRDGGLILAGQTRLTSNPDDYEAWLIKTDSNGNEEWNNTFEGESRYANFNSVQEISDGGYVLAGETGSGTDAWIVKVSPENQLEEDSKVILPVANFSANVTSGYAPLSVQFTDLSQNAASGNWDFGDGTNSTEQNPMHTYSAAGTYTVNLKAGNENGTSPTPKTATITVIQQGSSSGGSSGGSSHKSSSGSSGGGGAGGSPEPAKNVQVKEISQAFITSGKSVKFDFTKNATCVVYASFDAKKTVGKTTTIAEQLKGKSSLVSGLPSGEVYKYFNVWVGTGGFATSKNIENPVVCFKVEKSWLQDKNIDQASITLSRYSDKKWSQLPVKLLCEDNKYLYFTAETPEFSFFAITGKAVENEKVTETKPATDTSKLEQNGTIVSKTEQEQKSEQETGKGKATSIPGFGMVCGIVCLITVFLHKRR